MTSARVLYTSLQAETQEYDDRWAARQHGLGLFAYGTTADEASSRLGIAVNLLLDVLLEHGGPDAVTARLERAGIEFTVEETQETVQRAQPFTLTIAKPLD